MEKNILKQMYKPISIHEYNDEYFESLTEVIYKASNENTFNWFIKCINFFLFNEIDEKFKLSLIEYLKFGNNEEDTDDTSLIDISINNAELTVFSQAIVYECIVYSSDKVRASILSLALWTITLGIDKSLNIFDINIMKSFYRENSKSIIQNIRHYENDQCNSNSLDFINSENKLLKWMLNLDRKNYPELNDEQFVFFIGKEFAEKSGIHSIFNYPEAYLTKLLLSSSLEKNISQKLDIHNILDEINNTNEHLKCDNIIFPILHKRSEYNGKISLIEFVIQVYYEQILLNQIKINNYAG